MPIRTNKTRELYIAYVLDEETLRQLQQFLNAEVSEEVNWYISLSDGSSLSTTELTDLFTLPNTNKRVITGIRCKADASTERKEVDVRFRNYGGSIGTGSIVYEVTGDDKTVVYLSDKLEEFLLSQRQWYTPLRRTISGSLIQWVCLSVILNIINSKFHALHHLHSATAVSIEVALGLGLTILFQILLKYLFPVSFFVLGKGKQHYESARNFRAYLGVGLVVGIIAAYIGGWLLG